MPDAAAMLLASDQGQARAYAEVVAAVTGTSPVVVLSDDPKASAKLTGFRSSADRWLVAVRMASEGVDLPRLAVGVWATSYRTPLFFAQAVGRFARARRRGESAAVLLPSVRPLLALAADLEADRNHVLTPPTAPSDLLDPLPPLAAAAASAELTCESLGAEASFAHVLYGGRAVTGDAASGGVGAAAPDVRLPEGAAAEELFGLPGLLNAEQMALLLRQREAKLARSAPVADDGGSAGGGGVPRHEQAAALRREINGLVGRLAHRTGTPHALLHSSLRREVPGPPSGSAPLRVLRARHDHLIALL